MNKTLKQFCTTYNLREDVTRDAAYGNYSGYSLILKGTKIKQIIINLNVKNLAQDEESEGNALFVDRLQQLRTQFPEMIEITYLGNHLECKVTDDQKMTAIKLRDIVDKIVGILRDHGVSDCCKYCGNSSGLEWVGLDGDVNLMCGSCFTKMSENQSGKIVKKGNFGLVGILVGSLIGAIAWVIIYRMGYIAGIAGFLMIYCAILGYQKIGRRNDIKGIVISIVVSVVMLAAAEYVSLVIELKKEFDLATDIAIRFVWESFRQVPDVRQAIFKDLIVGYGLMAIASVSSIIQFTKRTDNKKEIVRL